MSPILEEDSPDDKPSTTPDDDAAQLDDKIPEIPKRSLWSNLCTIAIEQRRFWAIFLTGVLACIVTAQIFPVQAILLGRVLQVFQGPGAELTSDANFWSLIFFVVGLGALISYAVLGFFMTLLGVRLTRFYRLDYFRAILHQRMDFFDRVASGALVSRLTSDLSNLHDLISVNMGLLISIFFSIISGSIIALAFSWKFALVVIFGAMPAVFAAGFLRMKLDSSLAETAAAIFEESARFASDALSAFRTIKAFTMRDNVHQSYEHYLSSSIGRLYRKTAIIALFFALSESVELLAAALAFWYGGTLVETKRPRQSASSPSSLPWLLEDRLPVLSLVSRLVWCSSLARGVASRFSNGHCRYWQSQDCSQQYPRSSGATSREGWAQRPLRQRTTRKVNGRCCSL